MAEPKAPAAPAAPKEPKAPAAPVTNEDKAKALYGKGKNLYQIADEVFGFSGEEAVSKVRQLLGKTGEL